MLNRKERAARFNVSAQQQARGWQEEARRAAQNAAYWQKRAEDAEQQRDALAAERAVARALLTRWLARWGHDIGPGPGYELAEDTRAALGEEADEYAWCWTSAAASHITINGKPQAVAFQRLTYAAIVNLGIDPAYGLTTREGWTITYRHGPGNSEGSVLPGQIVELADGMIFNVRETGRA